MERFTFFWQKGSPFSQWYPINFTDGEVTYNCAEQYMMYHKAILFKDEVVARKILQTNDPKEHKKLGRMVKHFDDQVWKAHCMKIVYDGNYLKFTQNAQLKNVLLSTKGATLVEASPFDKIWGIGLRASDPRARYRQSWLGKNLLGEILTKLREDIIVEEKLKER